MWVVTCTLAGGWSYMYWVGGLAGFHTHSLLSEWLSLLSPNECCLGEISFRVGFCSFVNIGESKYHFSLV